MDINKFGIENHCSISNSSSMSTNREYCITNDFPGMFSRLIIYMSVLSTSQMERIYGMQFPFPDLRGNWSLGFLKLPHTEESHSIAQCRDCSERDFGPDLYGGKRGLCGRVQKKKEKGKKNFQLLNSHILQKSPLKKTMFFQIAVDKCRFAFVMITFLIICSTEAL